MKEEKSLQEKQMDKVSGGKIIKTEDDKFMAVPKSCKECSTLGEAKSCKERLDKHEKCDCHECDSAVCPNHNK